MKHAITSTLALASALALLAGCESPSKVAQQPTAAAPIETRAAAAPAPAAAPAAAAAVTPQSSVSTVDLASRGAAGGAALVAAPTQRVVYFDFDSFAIKDEYKGMLEGHARVLARQNDRRLVIEGHTDERGGREYNLALGQKRAEAVKSRLTLLGVADGQIETVSLGEEKPRATGSTEQAWAENRRADIVYR